MENEKMSFKRRIYEKGLRGIIYFCALLTVGLLAALLGYILVKGLPHISWDFLTSKPSIIRDTIGILPNILNTLYIIVFTLLIALPLAGGCTLVIMILSTIIRTTQESLKTVPQSYREGALALGATKWYMIRTIILPSSIDGIVTGCILSVGRIVGESAALLFTAGVGTAVANTVLKAFKSSGGTLSVALYMYVSERGEFEVGFAIAAILLILVLLINGLAKLAKKKLKNKAAG